MKDMKEHIDIDKMSSINPKNPAAFTEIIKDERMRNMASSMMGMLGMDQQGEFDMSKINIAQVMGMMNEFKKNNDEDSDDDNDDE